MKSSAALLALCLLAAALPGPAGATTYVMISDAALLDQAPVVVEAEVLAVEPAPVPRPATDYAVQVLRGVKGFVPGGTLVVRVPGGIGPDGTGFKVWGAPAFRGGDRALLFLVPRSDGTYGILHLMLGAFHRAEAGGRTLALRDLAEARQVGPGGPDRLRAFDPFRRWLEDRARGVLREADYFVDLPRSGPQSASEPFTLFVRDGKNFRWFEFDTGGGVPWAFHVAGYDGQGAGRPEFGVGRAAWNNDPDTPINYRDGGNTTSTSGFAGFDGVNAIAFNDPNGTIEGTYDCGTGGVLAIGGPWFDPQNTGFFNGREFIRILGGDVVTNDGSACFFGNPRSAEEVFAHELGHTLGLAHACGDLPRCQDPVEDAALMRASAHTPPIGARLNSDDRAAIRFLYGSPSAGPMKPAAPSDLAAVPVSMTEIELTWRDNSNNEQEFRVEQRAGSGAFVEIGTVGANTTGALADGLDPVTTYTFRVRAGNAQGLSAYSNESSATTFAAPGQACAENPTTLCLNGGRFQATAAWEVLAAPAAGGPQPGPAPQSAGLGMAEDLTDDTGYFWFFDPANVEVVIKVLDACDLDPFNNFWVFIAGLTDVEVNLTVIDTNTGMVKVYQNAFKVPFQPVQDTSAFATCGL